MTEPDISVTPAPCYFAAMTTVEEIEQAVSKLAPRELARFRTWFDDLMAARFDEKIARDAESGRLDALAEAALAEYRQGRARDL